MIDITLTQFTPAQAERIAGSTVMQQRNLRRHGYWEKGEGHARFNILDLARLLVIQCMGDKGIGPNMIATADTQGDDIASWNAAGIVWQAMGWADAYEGDILTFTPPWPPANDASIEDDLRERVDYLRRQTWNKLGLPRVVPAKFFIWWGDGSHLWTEDLPRAFSAPGTDGKYQSAIVILDLEALAARLCDRASVAFAHVEEVEG